MLLTHATISAAVRCYKGGSPRVSPRVSALPCQRHAVYRWLVPFVTAGVLHERERELQMLRDGLDRACAGEGALLVIEGPAGVGKTALIREARVAAGRAGIMPLEARGSELEQPFAFGVVRQLLEPVVSKPVVSKMSLGGPIFSRGLLVPRCGCSSLRGGGH